MNWADLSSELKVRIVKQEPEHFTAGGIRAVETKIAKPDQRGQSEDRQLVTSKEGVAFRVSLIVVSRRFMDSHDNLPFACKPLVDQITASLGFASDDKPRLQWRYHQIQSQGQPGVIVLIETL